MSNLTSNFEVHGMSCASCVGKVEKAIGGLEGVERVRANLVSNRVLVEHQSSLPPALVAHEITDLGYEVGTAELALSIEGMSCAACVAKVEYDHPTRSGSVRTG